ncbi:MAG: DUF4430 domain-containing protein, partial [Lachnospiraceae bacterium]|nr:DUF4430 domain-containing protein [Lachnospiraceae bacterium]
MKHVNKIISFVAVFALALGLVAPVNTATKTASAEDASKIVVWAAVDSLDATNATGTSLSIAKTPLHLEEGATATDAFKIILDQNGINYNIVKSEYGDYYDSIFYLGYDEVSGKYWNFTVNGVASEVGTSSYTLKNGDKINFLYQPYGDSVTEAPSFADDGTTITEEEATEQLKSAKDARLKLCEAIYKNNLKNGENVPGMESASTLLTVYNLMKAGFEAKDYYEKVYKNVLKQITAMDKFGGVKVKSQVGYDDDYNPIYEDTTMTFDTISNSMNAVSTYARTILFLGA